MVCKDPLARKLYEAERDPKRGIKEPISESYANAAARIGIKAVGQAASEDEFSKIRGLSLADRLRVSVGLPPVFVQPLSKTVIQEAIVEASKDAALRLQTYREHSPTADSALSPYGPVVTRVNERDGQPVLSEVHEGDIIETRRFTTSTIVHVYPPHIVQE